MSNPVRLPVATFNAGGGTTGSGYLTFSFAMTCQFEALIPITIICPGTTSISAGAQVNVYRSTDNGLTWETEPWPVAGFSKPALANQVQRADFVLETGYYLVSVCVGGGTSSTWTAMMGTADVLTAYN